MRMSSKLTPCRRLRVAFPMLVSLLLFSSLSESLPNACGPPASSSAVRVSRSTWSCKQSWRRDKEHVGQVSPGTALTPRSVHRSGCRAAELIALVRVGICNGRRVELGPDRVGPGLPWIGVDWSNICSILACRASVRASVRRETIMEHEGERHAQAGGDARRHSQHH